jgi:hypothetical protein
MPENDACHIQSAYPELIAMVHWRSRPASDDRMKDKRRSSSERRDGGSSLYYTPAYRYDEGDRWV